MTFSECWADCFRRSRKQRFDAEKQAQPFCGICGKKRDAAKRKFGQDLNVHEMTYKHEGHWLSQELIPLCRRCHMSVERDKRVTRQDSFEEVARLHNFFRDVTIAWLQFDASCHLFELFAVTLSSEEKTVLWLPILDNVKKLHICRQFGISPEKYEELKHAS